MENFMILWEELEKAFDWVKVRNAMKAIEWDWSFCKDANGLYRRGIPSIDTLKSSALSLLKVAYSQPNIIPKKQKRQSFNLSTL